MTAPRAPAGRSSLALLVLALALGGLVYQQSTSDYWHRAPQVAKPEPAADLALPPPLPKFQMPPLAEFATTLERPLFFPDRRPPEPDAAAQSEAPGSTETAAQASLDVVITGVILSDAVSFALVQRRGDSEVLRLAKGDIVDGWSVSEIMPDRVTFAREQELQEVELGDPSLVPGKTQGPDRSQPTARPRSERPGGRAPAAGSNDDRRR